MKYWLTLTAVTVALASAGCNGTSGSTGASPSPTTTPSPATTASPAAGAAVQANDADRAFIDGMIPHHEGAVTMADDALAKATHQELKTFAQKVKEDQAKEIADMKSWRQAWFGSATPATAAHGGAHGQMKPIPAGPDYDKQWAEEMIAHHQGAIEMAQTALAQAARPESKALAQRIIDAQKAEQTQLRAWIQAWGG